VKPGSNFFSEMTPNEFYWFISSAVEDINSEMEKIKMLISFINPPVAKFLNEDQTTVLEATDDEEGMQNENLDEFDIKEG